MKKLVILVLLLLNFGVAMTFADERIIVDRIANKEAEQLELQIPDETNPGPGKVTIEIINPDGSIEGTAYADFCKDLDGKINWNQPCTEFDEIYSLNKLNLILNREQLPGYEPAQEPDKNSRNMLAGLAALALIGSNTKKEDEEKEKEELELVDGGELKRIEAEPKWGDLSKTWDHPFTREIDAKFVLISEKTGSRSPLFSRKVADGAYLRAMLGSLATLLYPISFILAAMATYSVQFQAIPPKWYFFAALLVISTIDSFAGLVSAIVIFLATILSGHVTNRSEIMTLLGIVILIVAPAMIASSIRPIRRAIGKDYKWERLSDYALITLLSGWIIKGMIGSLNTLAHTQFAISFYANQIGLIVALAVIVRLALEDLAVHAYPVRLSITTPKKIEQSKFDKGVSKLLRIYIFLVIASEFIGINIKLLIGSVIFFLPTFLNLFGFKFKKTNEIYYWISPRGTFKIIAMIFFGGIFTALAKDALQSPKLFLAWSFVLLTIPGFVIQIISLAGKEPETDWKESQVGVWIYRAGGVLIFLTLTQVVRGVDIFAWVSSRI